MTNSHRARRRFGQNFLQDDYVIDQIVRAATARPAAVMVEIGPGLGALTAPLTTHCALLHVIEIDRDIVARLKKAPYAAQLQIYEADVLRFDLATIAGKKTIVGNLPYNISTPLMFHLIDYIDEIEEMFFMLQKEVVARICADAGDKNYGRLSVVMQYFFESDYLLDVPPTAFEPQPEVDSAVLRLIPNRGRIGEVADFAFFSRLVTQAFAMRRKTLRNNLKDMVSDADFAMLGINPQARPETIAAKDYVALAQYLEKKPQQ